MVIAATGPLSVPPDKLADLVASSATFQTWTGLASEALAKPRVYLHSRPANKIERPFALVGVVEGFAVRSGGHASGGLWLLFENIADPANAAEPDAFNDFANKVGAVLQEIMINSETSTLERLRLWRGEPAITVQMAPRRAQAEENMDIYQATFRVEYGLKS